MEQMDTLYQVSSVLMFLLIPPVLFQNQMLQTRVIKPLQGLLDCFHGPTRLIQKRQDKHLDYSASLQKKEKNKDPSKSKVASDTEWF